MSLFAHSRCHIAVTSLRAPGGFVPQEASRPRRPRPRVHHRTVARSAAEKTQKMEVLLSSPSSGLLELRALAPGLGARGLCPALRSPHRIPRTASDIRPYITVHRSNLPASHWFKPSPLPSPLPAPHSPAAQRNGAGSQQRGTHVSMVSCSSFRPALRCARPPNASRPRNSRAKRR